MDAEKSTLAQRQRCGGHAIKREPGFEQLPVCLGLLGEGNDDQGLGAEP